MPWWRWRSKETPCAVLQQTIGHLDANLEAHSPKESRHGLWRYSKLCTMLQSVFHWFSGLNSIQKVLAVLFAALLLFSLSFIRSSVVLLLTGAGEERSAPPSQQEGAAPGVTYPEEATQEPTAVLTITSARWEGDRAVVEGRWEGDISSVHCDLLEGGSEGSVTDWWDRGIPAQMSWSKLTFSQEFVQAEGREIDDPIDPTARYGVVCWAQYSDGLGTGTEAPVEGTPPG